MFNLQKFIECSSFYQSSPQSVLYFEALASTSDYAKKLVSEGVSSGTIVIADYQSGGRGRGAKSWHCEAGEGLLFSLVLDPDIDSRLWYRLSLATGVAIAKTLEKYGVDKVGLKWPNDVHIEGKKVAGILIEVTNGKVIVGVGMNISGNAHLDTATSLNQNGLFVEREVLLSEIVKAIYQWGSLCGLGYERLVDEYKSYCVLIGSRVSMRSRGERVTGRVTGLNEDGFLLLEEDNEQITCSEGHDILVLPD